MQSVRGKDAAHAMFRIQGGTAFHEMDDTVESWLATDDLSSLRFVKDQSEGSRERVRRHEIYPDRRTHDLLADSDAEQASSANPLDEASFLYLLRTVRWRSERRTISIATSSRTQPGHHRGAAPRDGAGAGRHVRRGGPAADHRGRGIFSEGNQVQAWLSNDDRRVLQLRSRLPIGSLNLYLTSANTAPPRPTRGSTATESRAAPLPAT